MAREHEPAPAERSRGELGTQVAAARVSRCAVAHRGGTGGGGEGRVGLASLCFPGVRDLGVHGGGEPCELAGDSRGRRGGSPWLFCGCPGT